MTSSRRSESPTASERLSVGRFVGHFGVRGAVRLLPDTDFPERLASYRRLLVRLPDGEERSLDVRSARPHKGVWILQLAGVQDVEAAEALRDATAYIAAEQAGDLPEGRFYDHQIVGLRVLTAAGEELGRVQQVLHTGANDVYIAGSWLIPATRDAICELDPAGGRLVVVSREYLEGEEVR